MMKTGPKFRSIIYGNEIRKPVKATIAMMPTNFRESL